MEQLPANNPVTFWNWRSNIRTARSAAWTFNFVCTDLYPQSEPRPVPQYSLVGPSATTPPPLVNENKKIKAASCVFCVLRCGGCSCAVLITGSSKWKKWGSFPCCLYPLWRNQLPLRLDKCSLSLSLFQGFTFTAPLLGFIQSHSDPLFWLSSVLS